MTGLLLVLLAPLASAQSQAQLLEGSSLLAPCLDDATCEPALRGLVSESLAEYGFALQADPLGASPLAGKGMGLVAEARLDSLTLGERNALEQQVPLPPALPRFGVGYQYGSYTYDDPYPQVGIGLTVLPPYRLYGGTLVGGQLDVGAAVPLAGHLLWGGAELGYGVGQLAVPLLGSAANLRKVETLEAHVERGQGSCADLDVCLDRFWQHAGHGRLGLSLEPVPALFLYTRVAAVVLVQRLRVAADDTLWGMGGLQPQAHLGGGLRAGDQYQLTLGTVIASRPQGWSTNDSRTLIKVVASTSFRFGRPRYWERDLPEAERASP